MTKLLSTATTILATLTLTSAQKFDPYQLNGGLVAAVAGRDYVLIASDTRLTDGGYGVHSRRYLSGRLWSASSSSTVINDDYNDDDLQLTQSTVAMSNTVHWDSDGSLLLPSIPNNNVISTNTASKVIKPTTTTTSNHPILTNTPIIIGSAGCASDCESLKRRMRLELDALQHHNNHIKLNVSSVANLLQQILYSRRGFPYYSFCVVAGLHPTEVGVVSSSVGEEGAVYVYDAIGSYERVAVGSAGTGRELLQPILDQLFLDHHGSSHDDGDSKSVSNNHSENGKSGDILAIPPMRQRVGVAGSLRPPVRTTVRCTVEDAVKNVARAYQAVAEREISVGDEVVICVVESAAAAAAAAGGGGGGGTGTRTEGALLKVYRYPLKKH